MPMPQAVSRRKSRRRRIRLIVGILHYSLVMNSSRLSKDAAHRSPGRRFCFIKARRGRAWEHSRAGASSLIEVLARLLQLPLSLGIAAQCPMKRSVQAVIGNQARPDDFKDSQCECLSTFEEHRVIQQFE